MRASLALLIALATLVPNAASAWCRMTTSRRQPTLSEPCILPDPTTDPPEQYLEWLRPCTSLTISLASPSDDLTDDEVRGVFSRSIATWEAVQCEGVPLGVDIELSPEPNTCDTPLYRDDGGNTNSVMFVLDWGERMYDPAAFAVTTVWHRRSTGEILDVDMEINERRGPYGICPPEGCTTRIVDLENVVTHEMGHYVGLAHSENSDATMYASAVAGEVLKRDLHDDDIEGLCTIYPPGRPEGVCDFEPRGGLNLDCEPGCSCSGPGRGGDSPFGFALLGLIALRALASRRRS